MNRLSKARRVSPAEQRFLQAQLDFRRLTKNASSRANEEIAVFQKKVSALGAAVKSKRPDYKKLQDQAEEDNRKAALQEQKRKEVLELLRRQEEKRKAKAAQEAFRLEVEKSNRQKLPSRTIDTRELVPVRLDAKTVVWVKPGSDPEAVKRKFRERNKNN